MHPVPHSDIKRLSLDTALRDVVDAIAETAYYFWERGWAESTAGNISVDVTALLVQKSIDAGEYTKVPLRAVHPAPGDRYFFVTARGARFRELAHRPDAHMLLIHIAGSGKEYHILWGNKENRATSELGTHLCLHAALVERDLPRRTVVHVHPQHLVALTYIAEYAATEAMNNLLWSMHPEMKMVLPDGVGFVPYTCPGTQELADATRHIFTDQHLLVWEKHGCVAWGADIHEAFDIIACANKAAEIFFICRSAGFDPEGLTPVQIRELHALHEKQRAEKPADKK